MKKTTKIALIILAVIGFLVIISPIIIGYYMQQTFINKYNELYHKSMVEYDKEHNTNYAQDGFN